jgi:hypothetical protein
MTNISMSQICTEFAYIPRAKRDMIRSKEVKVEDNLNQLIAG